MTYGPCYPVSEALYHQLGGKAAGLTPMQVEHEGVSHWYLRWLAPNGETYYLDATAEQFATVPPYAEGKGRGFLTSQPSRRASEVLGA